VTTAKKIDPHSRQRRRETIERKKERKKEEEKEEEGIRKEKQRREKEYFAAGLGRVGSQSCFFFIRPLSASRRLALPAPIHCPQCPRSRAVRTHYTLVIESFGRNIEKCSSIGIGQRVPSQSPYQNFIILQSQKLVQNCQKRNGDILYKCAKRL
jgi:hypothetical protein